MRNDPPHPLISTGWVSPVMLPHLLQSFRSAMTELGRWLTYEAARDWLPTEETMVTPWLPALPL